MRLSSGMNVREFANCKINGLTWNSWVGAVLNTDFRLGKVYSRKAKLSHHSRLRQTVGGKWYLRVSAITIFIWILVLGYVLRHSNFGPIPFHGVAAAYLSLYPQKGLFWGIFNRSSNSSFFMLWVWFLACNHHQDMWLEPYTWIFQIGKFLL